MQIQVSTDRSIPGREAVTTRVEAIFTEATRRFNSSIERVEVRIGAEGDAVRCSLEARLSGRAPLKVTHQAATLDLAVTGAAAELMTSLEGAMGRKPVEPPRIA